MTTSQAKPQREPVSKRTMLLIGFICVVLFGLVNLQRWLNYRNATEQVEKTALNLARALAQHGEDNIVRTDLVVSGLGFWIEHLDAGSRTFANVEQLFAQRMQEVPILQNLTWVDEYGRRLLAARTAPDQSNDNSDRDYFKWHRDHAEQQPHIGKPLRARATGTWIMTVSRRINKPDGSFGGVMLASLDLDFFKRYYAKFDIGELGLILFAHADGTYIVRRPSQEQAIGTQLNGGPVFAQIQADAENGNVQGVSTLDGIERVYGFQRLNLYPLLVAVAFDRTEVMAVWWQRTLRINLAMLGMLAFLIFLMWRLRQQQVLHAHTHQLLQQITDNLPMLVSYVDQQQRYRFLNQTYARAHARSTEQLIGKHVRDLVGAAAYAVAQPHLQAALAGEHRNFDFRANTFGQERDLRVQMLPQFNVSGGVDGVIIITTDISAELAREAELQQIVAERIEADGKALAAQQRELDIAYGIQQSLLMADVPTALNGAWIDTLIEPSQGLHGDFVAVSQHSPTRFNLLVGDVMGKGIHAAMIGAGTKNTYYQVLAELMAAAIGSGAMPGPATLINALHAKMTSKLIGMNSFVTLALYAFDVDAGTVTYVNAGHTPALLARQGSAHVEQLEGDNLPLGVLANEVYVEHVVAVHIDDQLVVYSDGISETHDPQGHEFGVSGIARWLSRCNGADIPGAAALQLLRQELANSLDAGRLADDQTLMMVRLRPVRKRPRQSKAERRHADSLTLPMRLEALPALRHWANGTIAHWLPTEADALLLAIFEAATNVILHTPAQQANASLTLRLCRDARQVKVELFYLGPPVLLESGHSVDFSGATEGGFGLHIMRRVFDDIRHEAPLPGLVRLCMLKHLHPAPAPAS